MSDDSARADLQLSVLPEWFAPLSVPVPGAAACAGQAISPPEQEVLSPEGAAARALDHCFGGDGRRHTPKGMASGWLEERLGNRQRQRPSVSYYYCWDQAEAGQVKRLKLYVKVRKLVQCRQMIAERWPAAEIVAFLQE